MNGATTSNGANVAGRWLLCGAVVLASHAAVAFVLLRAVPPIEPPAPEPAAVMVELAPDPQPEAAQPTEAPTPPQPEAAAPPPVPQPPAPEPPPPPEPAPPPDPAPPQPPIPQLAPEIPPMDPTPPMPAEVPLPLPPPPPPPPRPVKPAPPRPRPPPPPPRPARPVESPIPPQAYAPPAPAVAPVAQPAPAAPSAAAAKANADWNSDLINRIRRFQRYPDAARSAGEQGKPVVAFTLDRTGHVLSVNLVRGSGSEALDEEAVATIRRCDPFPPMPPDVPGATAARTVPINFNLTQGR